MKKKYFTYALVFFMMLSMLKVKAYAYSSVYYNNQIIKVGLESMKNSSALTAAVTGDYTLNGSLVKDGTSISLGIVNGRVSADGTVYDTISLIPAGSDSFLTLKSGNISRNYYGSMLFKIKSGFIYPINTVNIEDYVKGVIGYEMSDSFPMEALKAQAVASRTYGIYKIKAGSEFDVDDTTTYQVYKGFNKSFINVPQAVEATKGEILFYNGYVLSNALFSADNGGYTEDAANVWGNPVSYLQAKKDDFDDYTRYSNSKNYDWLVTYTNQQLTDILNSKLLTSGNSFVSINTSTIAFYISGRVSNLEINYLDSTGTVQTMALSKNSARTFFGLKSAMYTVTYNEEAGTYAFNGHGNGHGLGMSQIGAVNRAQAGQTYVDILAFYYDGATVENRMAGIAASALNKSNVLTGEEVTATIQGQGGSGPDYLYKYELQKDGQTIALQDYSATSTYSYTPDNKGSYTLTVYLKDKLSSNLYDDKVSLNFNVTGFADINLDNIVDIYDLVDISRNFDSNKDSSSNWDGKMDLNNDGVIDIFDLSKASEAYNTRY
ncbi:MAG: SpoIID/LytB domain-containing protein [Bacillota bacterium]|nr:SpoIID/LytB domain-containing protein [Bacillota bacterium]